MFCRQRSAYKFKDIALFTFTRPIPNGLKSLPNTCLAILRVFTCFSFCRFYYTPMIFDDNSYKLISGPIVYSTSWSICGGSPTDGYLRQGGISSTNESIKSFNLFSYLSVLFLSISFTFSSPNANFSLSLTLISISSSLDALLLYKSTPNTKLKAANAKKTFLLTVSSTVYANCCARDYAAWYPNPFLRMKSAKIPARAACWLFTYS